MNNAQGNIIDFTTWRKGKKTRGKLKIETCPVCGLKGEYQHPWTDKKGRKHAGQVVHKQHLESLIPGFQIWFLDKVCLVKNEE